MSVYVDDVCIRDKGKDVGFTLTADSLDELHRFAKKAGLRKFVPCPIYESNIKTIRWGWNGKCLIGCYNKYIVPKCQRNKIICLGAIPVVFGNEPWRDKLREYNEEMYRLKAKGDWDQFDTSYYNYSRNGKVIKVKKKLKLNRPLYSQSYRTKDVK